MPMLPQNEYEIMEIFRRYDFRDPLGHPLENCVEFKELVSRYCEKEPTLQGLYDSKDAIDDAVRDDAFILTGEQLIEMFDRVARRDPEVYERFCKIKYDD